MTKKQLFKHNLYNLLKNDIALEIYNNRADGSAVFSFFHLDSVYNGLIYYYSNKTYMIDYQYHRKTKTLDKLLTNFVVSCAPLKFAYIEKEVDYYRKLSHNVFINKYDLSIGIHTLEQ